MKNDFERALEKWGQGADVTRGGITADTLAFVQPIKRDAVVPPYDMTELGESDERLWRWLGRADTAIARGDEVVCEGMTFEVLRAEKVYLGNEAQYTRALLRAVPEG